MCADSNLAKSLYSGPHIPDDSLRWCFPKQKEKAMSEKGRKSFTSQHKAKVALEAVRSIKTVNEIAQEFGVHPSQVGQWKKELQTQAPSIFDTKRGPKKVDASADSDRLFAEIGRLKMDNDWLKKKLGIGQ
jgi:transposase-like protein